MSTGYLNIAVGIAAFVLLLSGCSNPTEETQTSLSVIEEQRGAAVQEFTQLTESEGTLQESFETALKEDGNLDSFGDGSAALFTNIEERNESLTALEDIKKELAEQQEVISGIDSDELSEESMGAVAEPLDSLTGTLEEFITSYEEDLSSQKTYFESLGQEDATYDTLRDGIASINDEREDTRSLLEKLDAQMVSLEEGKNTLSAQLDEASSE